MSSEDKSFSECIEDDMRQDIEAHEGKQQSIVRPSEPLPNAWQRFEKEYITPILDKETEIPEEEGRQVRLLSSMLERAAAKIKNKLRLNRIVVFAEVSERNPLEIDRNAETKIGHEYRKKLERAELEKQLEQRERYELLQVLPGLGIEIDEPKPDPKAEAEAEEARLLAEARSEEERQRKLRTP